jgi:hypothetical protein
LLTKLVVCAFIFSLDYVVSLVSTRAVEAVTFAQSSAKVTKSALCCEKPKKQKITVKVSSDLKPGRVYVALPYLLISAYR